ncbi:MAG: dephospho-CoA kinase [Flavobacteriales bacterium]
MRKAIQIGLTGGIGSGKSTVAKVFELLRVPVYYADNRSKSILQNNPSVKEKLREFWGEIIFDSAGNIDTKALANIVFNNESELQKLNALLHPLVAQDYAQWLSEQTSAYVIKEAAILIESGSYKTCDKIIVVTVPQEIAIERVKARDHVSEEQVKARISKQLSVEEKLKYADFVIVNDGVKMLIPQILEIHNQLK